MWSVVLREGKLDWGPPQPQVPGALALVGETEQRDGRELEVHMAPLPILGIPTPPTSPLAGPVQDSLRVQTLFLVSNVSSLRPCIRSCFSLHCPFSQISISRPLALSLLHNLFF